MITLPRCIAAVAYVAFLATAGCVTHIAPYKPKHRVFDSGEYGEATKSKNGSLYATTQRGLMEDDRASRVGDIVVIQIDERETGVRDAQSTLQSQNNINLGITGAIQLLAKANPALDLGKLFGSNSQFAFQGGGTMTRKGQLSATLPVRVRELLPNGDLYVEGTKVVMVSNEEHHLYVSGIVRAIDILGDGTVPSSKLADAEIEYTGRGDLSDKQRPGWLSRILQKLWPF